MIIKFVHCLVAFMQAPVAFEYVYCPRCGPCNDCSMDLSNKSPTSAFSTVNTLVNVVRQCWDWG